MTFTLSPLESLVFGKQTRGSRRRGGCPVIIEDQPVPGLFTWVTPHTQ